MLPSHCMDFIRSLRLSLVWVVFARSWKQTSPIMTISSMPNRINIRVRSFTVNGLQDNQGSKLIVHIKEVAFGLERLMPVRENETALVAERSGMTNPSSSITLVQTRVPVVA